jgi:hypothetical protein
MGPWYRRLAAFPTSGGPFAGRDGPPHPRNDGGATDVGEDRAARTPASSPTRPHAAATRRTPARPVPPRSLALGDRGTRSVDCAPDPVGRRGHASRPGRTGADRRRLGRGAGATARAGSVRPGGDVRGGAAGLGGVRRSRPAAGGGAASRDHPCPGERPLLGQCGRGSGGDGAWRFGGVAARTLLRRSAGAADRGGALAGIPDRRPRCPASGAAAAADALRHDRGDLGRLDRRRGGRGRRRGGERCRRLVAGAADARHVAAADRGAVEARPLDPLEAGAGRGRRVDAAVRRLRDQRQSAGGAGAGGRRGADRPLRRAGAAGLLHQRQATAARAGLADQLAPDLGGDSGAESPAARPSALPTGLRRGHRRHRRGGLAGGAAGSGAGAGAGHGRARSGLGGIGADHPGAGAGSAAGLAQHGDRMGLRAARPR